MPSPMNKEERWAFLSEPRIAVVAIPEPGRGPLTAPVWYMPEDDGTIWFETEPDSRKGRLLEVGTRISLCIQQDTSPYAYVAVEGPIKEVAEDDRELHELPMAIRYLGEERGREYIANLPPSVWKRYIMQPEHWRSMKDLD